MPQGKESKCDLNIAHHYVAPILRKRVRELALLFFAVFRYAPCGSEYRVLGDAQQHVIKLPLVKAVSDFLMTKEYAPSIQTLKDLLPKKCLFFTRRCGFLQEDDVGNGSTVEALPGF